jgi:hypothetical protein
VLIRCKFSHSVKEYLAQKEDDVAGICPVFEAVGKCGDGWRCRWLGGHIRPANEGEEGLDGWVLVVDEEVRFSGRGLILESEEDGL